MNEKVLRWTVVKSGCEKVTIQSKTGGRTIEEILNRWAGKTGGTYDKCDCKFAKGSDGADAADHVQMSTKLTQSGHVYLTSRVEGN
jgi:hypothetical protein